MSKRKLTAMNLLEAAHDLMKQAKESVCTALTDPREEVPEGLLGFHVALRTMRERLVRSMENTELRSRTRLKSTHATGSSRSCAQSRTLWTSWTSNWLTRTSFFRECLSQSPLHLSHAGEFVDASRQD